MRQPRWQKNRRCNKDVDNKRSFHESSTLGSLVGPDESNDPMAMDVRDRGEYSADSLRADE